jgi:hypothetical protein
MFVWKGVSNVYFLSMLIRIICFNLAHTASANVLYQGLNIKMLFMVV